MARKSLSGCNGQSAALSQDGTPTWNGADYRSRMRGQSIDRLLLLGVASIHAKAKANPRTVTATTRMPAVCRKPSPINVPPLYRYVLRLVRLLAVHSSYKRMPMVTTKPDPITPAIKNSPIIQPRDNCLYLLSQVVVPAQLLSTACHEPPIGTQLQQWGRARVFAPAQ